MGVEHYMHGDGTISFVTAIKRLAAEVPDPERSRAEDGGRTAAPEGGCPDLRGIFDAPTGDCITTNVSFKGLHVGAEGEGGDSGPLRFIRRCSHVGAGQTSCGRASCATAVRATCAISAGSR
jgi:hypothetical protein